MSAGASVRDEPRDLAGLVRRAAASAPAKAALVCGPRRLTWTELDSAVDALAAGLRGRGLTPGDRVGLLLPNGIEFAVAYFGVLRAGGVAVPLNTAYTAAELGYQVEDSGAALVLADSALADRVDAPTVVPGTPEWDELTAAAEPVEPPDGGEQLAVLLYTSGTTGRPKGAMLSHRALLSNLRQLARIEPPVVRADDVALLVLPLFHVYGLNAGLGLTAYAGATGILADRFDPVETLALVREHSVTSIIGAPPMYVAWSMLPELKESFRSLRLAVSGAAPLPPTVLAAVQEATGQPVYEGYGLAGIGRPPGARGRVATARRGRRRGRRGRPGRDRRPRGQPLQRLLAGRPGRPRRGRLVADRGHRVRR
jgi:long-chain acyl-CoA synthetase